MRTYCTILKNILEIAVQINSIALLFHNYREPKYF